MSLIVDLLLSLRQSSEPSFCLFPKVQKLPPFPLYCVWSRDLRKSRDTVRHIGPPTFLFRKQRNDKKGNRFSSSVSIKGHPTTGIMQSEESTTTTDELENMHYGAQAQESGVLDPTTIEEGAFEAAMAGDHDGHGLKRQADSDDDADAESSMLVEERPKKKTRGRVKIEMKFISNKLRRYTTFSKRKTGIMKKVVLQFLNDLIIRPRNFIC